LCPCWICLGDFDCCALACGQDLPVEVLRLVITHPFVWLRSGGPRELAVGMIRRYQVEVSAKRPAICHFTPSCSNYGLVAINTHGLVRGLWLIAHRLWRCRTTIPWGTPDPVPFGGASGSAF
jgi:putative membrane protein insertion efficiency factor